MRPCPRSTRQPKLPQGEAEASHAWPLPRPRLDPSTRGVRTLPPDHGQTPLPEASGPSCPPPGPCHRSPTHTATWPPHNLATRILLSRIAPLEERFNGLFCPVYQILTAGPEPSLVHRLLVELGTVECKAHSILSKHRRLTSLPPPQGSNDLSKIIIRTQTAQLFLPYLRGITENATKRQSEGVLKTTNNKKLQSAMSFLKGHGRRIKRGSAYLTTFYQD